MGMLCSMEGNVFDDLPDLGINGDQLAFVLADRENKVGNRVVPRVPDFAADLDGVPPACSCSRQ